MWESWGIRLLMPLPSWVDGRAGNMLVEHISVQKASKEKREQGALLRS